MELKLMYKVRTLIELQFESNSWLAVSFTINIISVIVIVVLVGFLLKSRRNGSSISCPSRTDQTLVVSQVEDTEGLNYAALRFSKKLTSRAPRAQESPVMYSQIWAYLRAEKMNPHPLTEMVIETGESVTLQCSVQSLTSHCSGEHSVYWFRHGSGESHPGIIYTHGNRSDQCKSSSETDSSTQSCVYKLPKRNLSLSDAGTYYCAVAACGQILFGNGTKVFLNPEVNVQENNSWIIITLVTLNVTSVIVILILLKKRHKGAENVHPSHINQAENTEVLKYAALRAKDSQDLYSRVEYC
ncbi:hypothetical protein NFI96_016561 [Prochilodus magdalenae]|nr:hypothetical protein NFI96_016561 [Prochilodus magdalenae]